MTRTQLIGLLSAIFLFVAIYFVFSFAEIETTMLEVQKIFYFHVSSAFTVFLAFGVTSIFSILYLIKRKDKYDTIALVSTEIGIVFGVSRVYYRTYLGEICLEYLVELGTEVNKRINPLADIYRLPYSEVCPSGRKKTGLFRSLGHHRFPECAYRLLLRRTLAGWLAPGH